jgi:hypothetical protein
MKLPEIEVKFKPGEIVYCAVGICYGKIDYAWGYVKEVRVCLIYDNLEEDPWKYHIEISYVLSNGSIYKEESLGKSKEEALNTKNGKYWVSQLEKK